MIKDTFLTIESTATGELKILGSHFIGNAVPVSEKEDAEEFIHSIIKKYHDATHNPFAYRLINEQSEIIRTSDDREPSGTAGKPILSAIEKQNLYNAAVVITRYFGGKKLGKGRLMRAYRDCTEITLNNTKIIQKVLYKKVFLEFPYDKTGNIMKIITDFNGKINNHVYKDKYSLDAEIPINLVEEFKNKIFDIAGKSEILIKL